MSNIRFDQIGSLFRKDGSYFTGKCLYSSLLWQSRDEFDEDDIPRGPFTEAESFYKALISALFVHVTELSMEHHLFQGPVLLPEKYDDFQEYRIATDRWNDYVAVVSKTDSMQNRLDYALVGLSLQDSVPLLAEKDNHTKCRGLLSQPDLSCQNIFVDDEFNITCIIDWAFASSIPHSMLLVRPGLPYPRDRIQPSLTNPFSRAFVAAGGFDGEKDLYFSYGSIFWAFSRLVNLDALQDHLHFSGFLQKLTGQEVCPYLHRLREREEIKQIHQILLTYEVDEKGPNKDEKRYFSCVGHERYALSQHLTMIAEMNKDFVALLRATISE